MTDTPPHLPTRRAVATVVSIDADLHDTSTPGRRSFVIGGGTVYARTDVNGSDYRWHVTNPRDYRVGDTVEVDVPA